MAAEPLDLRHTLSTKELENLKNYQYRGSNASIVYQHFLKPFAAFWVRRIPTWLAPNAMTLFGLALCWVNFAFMAVLNPHMDAPIPPWAYIVCGLNLFVYQTLDNMDGQQARRLGMSSPLGQLLDHGCDAISVSLTTTTFVAALQCGPRLGLLFVLGCELVFFVSTWDEYHTKELHLALVNGPDDGLVVMTLTYFIAAFLPPNTLKMWTLGPFTVGEWGTVFVAVSSAVTCYALYVRVRRALASTPGGMRAAMRQLLPFAAFFCLSILWVFFPVPLAGLLSDAVPGDTVEGNNSLSGGQGVSRLDMDLTAGNPFVTFASILLVFGYITCKLMLATVCGHPYSAVQPALALLLAPVLNGYLGLCLTGRPMFDPWAVQSVCFALVAALFTHFSVSLVSQVAQYLGIELLYVPTVLQKRKD